MTCAALLLRLLRLAVRLAVLVAALAGSGAATAAELRVSDLPHADILDRIAEAGNADGPLSGTVSIRNDTAEAAVLRLTTEQPEPVAFTIRAEGRADPVLVSARPARARRTHASQGPPLASPPLVLAPGEALRLSIRFEAMAHGRPFPVALVAEARHAAVRTARATTHGLYFGAVLVLVIYFLVFSRALGSRAALRFALYLTALAALNAQSHGYPIALTGAPEAWSFPLVRGLQVAVMVAYLAFAAAFLKADERYPRLAWAIRAHCLVLVAVYALETLSGTPVPALLVDAAALGFLLAGAWMAYLALRDRHDGAGYFATGFAILLAGGLLNYVASDPAFATWNEALDRTTLTLQIADAFVFAMAVISRTRALRAERDRAVERQLAAYRDRLAVAERLDAAQADLTRARALAEGHRARLASTSHDLRQPLAALRLAVNRAHAMEAGVARDLETGLDYLDGVLGETLAQARPGESADAPADAPCESVPLQIVFDTVARMFDGEAGGKGLDLRVAPTALVVRMPAIDLVRMVSNLVANAIRYTDRGGVLIGARRGQGGTARVEVVDTGRGIPAEELDAVRRDGRRGAGADTDGEGMGLAIVDRLARRNGLTLHMRSRPGSGSRFALHGLRPATPCPKAI